MVGTVRLAGACCCAITGLGLLSCLWLATSHLVVASFPQQSWRHNTAETTSSQHTYHSSTVNNDQCQWLQWKSNCSVRGSFAVIISWPARSWPGSALTSCLCFLIQNIFNNIFFFRTFCVNKQVLQVNTTAKGSNRQSESEVFQQKSDH